MADPIKLINFLGMNNMKIEEGLLQDSKVEPRIVLNADVTDQGRIVKRAGRTLFLSLTNPHSLWAGKLAMLCIASGYLYRLDQGVANQICAVNDPDGSMDYTDIEDKVYLSNRHWNGIFNPTTNIVSNWGLTLPEQPILSLTSGNLSAGTYSVCFTVLNGGELSGNGPIAAITVGENTGITISNRSADDIVWITDPDGKTFHPAGQVDVITATPASVEPLPSFLCALPPFMEYLAYHFGRVWGSRDSTLYYSEPFHPEWFKTTFDRFEFKRNITLIAKVPTGIFVGCEDATYFLQGTEPHKMEQKEVGKGAIAGTLKYCNNLPELSDILSPAEKVYVSVPIWLSQEGIVIGNASGRLFNLTQQKIRFVPGKKGASLHRMRDGRFQFLTSFKQGSPGSGIGMSDSATLEVIRKGRVFTGNWGNNSFNEISFGDIATLEVNP